MSRRPLLPAPSESHFDPIDWQGHWIGPELILDPTGPLEAFAGSNTRRPFSRTLFRRSFALSDSDHTGCLRLTADARYVLWINGRLVGRGPVRSQPRRWHYDEYDILPFLQDGPNVVAVLVTYYGQPTSFWLPAIAAGGIGADALLAVEAVVDERSLVSDAEWTVLRSHAWTRGEDPDHADEDPGLPIEIVDARAIPPGWTDVGFDDSAWTRASVISAIHSGALARTRPPTNPYGRLLPRPIGALGGEVVAPSERRSRMLARPEWPSPHPADRVRHVLSANLAVPCSREPSPVSLDGDHVVHVSFDFGRIVAGFVEFDLAAASGTVVELLYRERDELAGSESISIPRTGARYVHAAGSGFRALEVNGLRYLDAIIHSATLTEVDLQDVVVREQLYPTAGAARFTSDDPELDRLYEAGVRTVELNSFDAFIDCPTREQRAWVGDGVVHQMVQLVVNADWRLARYYVELGDSPRPDGILPMSVAGDIEDDRSFTIPDWSLHWIHGLYNLYRYTGDRDTVLAHLPTADRILRWFDRFRDSHGTLSHLSEWNLIDWSSVFTDGRSGVLTGLWGRALIEVAEISQWVGNSATAEWTLGRHAAAAVGFADFWDPERGLYLDRIPTEDAPATVSQAGNAVAIVSRLAPESAWEGIADRMTDRGTLVTRSWIGGYDHGGYDRVKADQVLRGRRVIDWDHAKQVVRAEPFFSYIVHDALAAAGRHDTLAGALRDWSAFLTGGYDTFGECWGWGTPVHGWSSTPARDMVAYIAGVVPDLPGYERVAIAPHLGTLRHMTCTVPTPHGYVTVRVDDDILMTDCPVPARVTLRSGAVEHLTGPGRHEFTIR